MFILARTERAFAELLATASISASLDVSIYNGLDNETKAAPAIVISAESATEDFPDSGVWRVKTSLKVKEIASDTSVTSSLASTVFAAVLNDSAKTILSTYPNYYCHAFIVEDSAISQEGDTWVQTLTLDVVSSLT